VSGPGDSASKRDTSKEPTPSDRAEGHGESCAEVGQQLSLFPGSKSSARSHTSSARKPGDLAGASPRLSSGKQRQEGVKPEAVAVSCEESEAPIVPRKSGNPYVTVGDSMEGRGAAKGKLAHRNARRTQGRGSALTDVERVGKRAERHRRMPLGALFR
jgi:hypothetical protein